MLGSFQDVPAALVYASYRVKNIFLTILYETLHTNLMNPIHDAFNQTFLLISTQNWKSTVY